ncbi:MAG: cytochrome c oxidase subunit 4 [Geodermatophilaceae bacterium]|nr:cytochrome c oxidase subunit 4 [Geodermatophilaceae bacterium]
MKLEAYLFSGTAVFLFGSAVVYGIFSSGEPVGVAALVLSGGLCIIVGGFFWFVSRRIDARPEDRKDAEIAEGAGELGFFAPGSYWPITLAAAAALTGLSIAYYMWWLIVVSLVALLAAVSGLLFEYYTRANAAH